MMGKMIHLGKCHRKHLWGLIVLAVLGLYPERILAQASLRIAAIVNDEAISVYDLNNRARLVIFSARLPGDPATLRRVRAQVMRNLIDERLRLQEAKKQKITVEKREIDLAVRDLETRNKISKGQLRQFLNGRGIDKSTLISQIEANIAWIKVVRRSVRSGTAIGEDAIDEALAQMKANKGKPEYLIGEIFLPFTQKTTVENMAEFANKLVGQIRNGADFSTVAKTFSASASATLGGRLGWMRSDQIAISLARALERMQVKELSQPIKALDGYYILQVHGKRLASSGANTEIVMNLHQIFLPLPKNAAPDRVKAGMGALRGAVRGVRVCGDMKKAGAKLKGGKAAFLKDIKLTSLPNNLGNVVGRLGVGRVSPPVRMPAGLVAVMVCTRKGGGPDSKIRERVGTHLRGQRADMVSRRLLRNLRRSAFIDIRK